MGPNILVAGSINMDLIIRTPRIPLSGENVFGKDFQAIPGGKGANQAVGVARLGYKVALSGRVGRDYFGNSLLKSLRDSGVDTAHVEQDAKSTTGIATILIDENGESRIIITTGANGRFSIKSAVRLQRIMDQFDLVLLQLELPLDSVSRIIEIARSLRKEVVLDAGPPCTKPRPSFFNVTVLTPNKTEAEAISGKSITDLRTAHEIARYLLKKGPEAVVLKLGNEGAFLTTKTQEKYFPAHKVNVVDTTAAGDAFSAALSVAIVEGMTLQEAVKFANAAGALAVTKLGAHSSLPTRQEVETLLSQK